MELGYLRLNLETGCLEKEDFEKVLAYLKTDEGRKNTAYVLMRIPGGDRDSILSDLVEGNRTVF